MQFTINTQHTTTNSQTHMHKISAPCEKQKIEDSNLVNFQVKRFLALDQYSKEEPTQRAMGCMAKLYSSITVNAPHGLKRLLILNTHCTPYFTLI